MKIEELHTKLQHHLDEQAKNWKSFIYAQEKGFYQGFEEIDIDGWRPTEKRFNEYIEIINDSAYGNFRMDCESQFKEIQYTTKEIFNYFRDIKELLKITQLIIVGVLPAAAVGLLLPIEELIDSSRFILIITFVSYCFLALILIFIEKFDEGQKTLSDLTLKNALYIGLAQSLALLPGISRSGITLATAISLKVKKTEAIFFSLLLGIPTIFGAWVLTFLQSDNQIETSFLLPVVVAFISGLLAIKILINFTVNSKLQIFAKYCLFMGILSLVTYLVNL